MLKKNNVDVISISEPIADNAFGGLIERVIEWMDEYYSIRLSGDVIRGMTESASRGRVQASPPFGYKIINQKYELIQEHKPVVEEMFDMFIKGNTCADIAAHLNLKGVTNNKGNRFESRNIKYIIANPVYMGATRWNYSDSGRHKIKDSSEWIIIEDTHEPIISRETFLKAQELLKYRNNKYENRKPHSNEYKHWLGGLLRCSSCGGTLTYAAYSKSSLTENSKYKGYFLCNKFRKKSCDVKNSITIRQAEILLLDTLKEDLKDLELGRFEKIITTKKDNNNNELDNFKQQLNKIPIRLKKAKDLYINGIDTLEEFSETKAELMKEKAKLEEKISQLEASVVDNSAMINNIKTVIDMIENNADKFEINAYLKKFISQIVIDRANQAFEVHYFS